MALQRPISDTHVPGGGHLTTPDEGAPPSSTKRIGPASVQIPGAVLRPWDPADAYRLDHALELSRQELLFWTPWVLEGVGDLAALQARLRGYRSDFRLGHNLLYAVLDRRASEVLGGAGLYRRVGVGALEVGYWIRSDQTGRGLATRVTEALVSVGFGFDDVQRIEIHCRSDNRASIRIPQKIGFQLQTTKPGTPDRPGKTEVWELLRAAWRGRLRDSLG